MAFEFQFSKTGEIVNLDVVDQDICDITKIAFDKEQYNPGFMYITFTVRAYGMEIYKKTEKEKESFTWDTELENWLKATSDINDIKLEIVKKILSKYTFHIRRYW